MKPQKIARSGNGASSPAILDPYGYAPVALQVVVTSGTPNWTVQQTLDDPNDPSVTPTWLDHADTNMVAQTANRQSNYSFAPYAVRVVINSGGGSVLMTVIQSGGAGSKA